MDDSTTFEIFKKQLQKSNNKQIGNVIAEPNNKAYYTNQIAAS